MLDAVATKTDDVAPTVGLKYRLYDAERRKRLAKGDAQGYTLTKKHVREAVNDAPFFVDQYPTVVNSAVLYMIGNLYRGNHLHALADSIGYGDKVLPLGKVTAPYEIRFKYEPSIPKGWRNVRMNSKLVHVVEPKSDDRLRFGVRHDIDLLIAEFGQDVTNVDEYAAIFFGRLQENGYDISKAKEFADLKTKNSYKVVSIDRPDGLGKELFLFRTVDATFVEGYSIVFTKDFDSLYSQYRENIVSVIDNSRLTMRK
jgi:hypothetical protein